VAFLVLGGAGYVVFRMFLARNRGQDASEAGRRALSDALPVIGAGLAGVFIFFAILSVVAVLLLFLFIALLTGDGDELSATIVVLVLVGVVVLIGLPGAALIWVARRRRRERPGG
jgi:hypothetical protein